MTVRVPTVAYQSTDPIEAKQRAQGIAKTSKKTSKPTPAVDDAFDIGNAIDDVIEAPLQPQIAVVEPVALDREPDASVVKA